MNLFVGVATASFLLPVASNIMHELKLIPGNIPSSNTASDRNVLSNLHAPS